MSKLLILDNSAEHLSLLTYFLEKKQYEVKALTNALDVFSGIYNYKPDLLLLDTLFGSTDGKDFCRQLRTTGKRGTWAS
jgi:DNA-binding response OmpR family regulator